MDWFLLALLAIAFLLALLRGAGFSGPGRIDFGWLAIACLILSIWLLPVLWRLKTPS